MSLSESPADFWQELEEKLKRQPDLCLRPGRGGGPGESWWDICDTEDGLLYSFDCGDDGDNAISFIVIARDTTQDLSGYRAAFDRLERDKRAIETQLDQGALEWGPDWADNARGYIALYYDGKFSMGSDSPDEVHDWMINSYRRFLEVFGSYREELKAILDMSRSSTTLQEKLARELLSGLRQVSPANFERLCVRLLEAMRYGKGIHLGQTSDGGVDGMVRQDALGLEKVYIQAKRWANPVGAEEVRGFAGSLDTKGSSKGVFITTSTFTKSAKSTADSISQGSKQITLVDGAELAGLMISYGVGVVTQETYEVKKLDKDYFTEQQ